ncbi:MAG: glycosyltransferase family 4 protein [Candidatus Cyclobacteriaceae bacterium M3_2C_046]
MKKVVHFARKLLPPTASFIYNQVSQHQNYKPYFVYCESVESAFLPQMEESVPTFKSTNGLAGKMVYKYLRKLTAKEEAETIDYVRRKQADVLHFHYGVDALVYHGVIRQLKLPVVVSFYGYDCTSFPKRLFRYGHYMLKKYIFFNPHITYVTAMSPDMALDLQNLGCPPEKIITHYHGINTKPFIQKREYPNKETINFLIISGLSEKKGHLFLLKALQVAQETTDKKLRLTIVGQGSMEDKIKSSISELGLNNVELKEAVKFGSVDHLNYLKAADVFVHPSITPENGDKEGIPGALVEAMAAGLPVIATYHAGIPYIINHQKTGLLAREWDIEQLAQLIKEVAEHSYLRAKIGREAQKYALDALDINQKEKDLEEIYDKAINGKLNLKRDKVEG